jgi:hypothetical protein
MDNIIDNIIIMKHSDVLLSSPLQFGFKPNHSTVQCVFAVNEVIHLFVNNDSVCHILLLDASKAFDRVHFVKLFDLLIKRDMCPLAIVFLIYVYTHQSMSAKWNGLSSASFGCQNGVKQGGVLSPLLFCVYVDELLCRLKALKTGCHIGHTFTGAFGYADDLTLLAPSISSAKEMLHECERFANEFHVLFNASKSLHQVLSKRILLPNNVCSLTLNGDVINKQSSAKLLGVNIGSDSESLNLKLGANDLTCRTNVLLSKFSYCDSNILFCLFNAYCTHFYASPLWCFENSHIKQLIISWKKMHQKNLATKSTNQILFDSTHYL